MFDTGEWNDNPEAQALTESLVSTQKQRAADAKQEKGAISRRKRLKRNRQLIEVLQTLKSFNAQNPDLPPPLEDVCPPGKQKKVTPDIISEESSTSKPEAPPPDTGTRLSRKQWKNKMKNKKKNRNKFKPCAEKQKTTVDSGEDGEFRTGGGGKAEYDPSGDSRKDHGGTGAKEGKRGAGSWPQRSSNKKEAGIGLFGGGATDKDGGQKEEKATSADRKCESASPRMTAVEKARLEKLKKLLKKEQARKKEDVTTEQNLQDAADPDDSNLPEEDGTDRSASLRSRMEQRLHSARFRYINEQLYTSDSQQAVRLFQNDPEAFNIYHTGFSQQVQRWPVSPITEIIKYVKNRPPSLVVADFGCGDARLARSVRNKVHSFDLVALNDHVTVCDIAQVPLSDETVDIAVFCLSLMGKNLSDFLKEANRVLKMEGVLLVAEVSSRFDDVRQFMTAMSQLGFKCVNKNTENSHFYLFEFSKVRLARDASRHPGLQLKPCLYKKR